MHWDDLKTVLALVRGGSLTASAAELEVSYTTVARRISRIESDLGETLFERLTDGYRPTDAAHLIAEEAARMEEAEMAMLRRLTGRDDRLSGVLTLTAPQLVIAHVLGPVLAAYRAAYPEVELNIRATNDLLDLNRREADLALRISASPGDTLKGLRLMPQNSAIYATQAWADRFADDPSAELDWILYSGYRDLGEAVLSSAPGARVRYWVDDMVAIIGAVQAGLGLARLPMFLGRTTTGLVEVPILPPQPYPDVWMVAHPDVWPAMRVAAFREIAKRELKPLRPLFVA